MKKEMKLLNLKSGSDIRGVAMEGGGKIVLSESVCTAVAFALTEFLQKRLGKKAADMRIGVGHDSRLSASLIQKAVQTGLLYSGVSVVNMGLITTPSAFMACVFEETAYDATVMITASHMPFQYNGLKFFTKDGGFEAEEVAFVLEAAQKYYDEEKDFSEIKGALTSAELLPVYAEYLRSKIKEAVKEKNELPLEGLKIAVDAGNGSGGFFAHSVLEPLGADVSASVFLEPDGRFPNHIPNPEEEEAMKSISHAVTSSGADIGFVFDTDVDRLGAVFGSGSECNRERLIALICAILSSEKEENKNSTVVTDSVTSCRLTRFLETLGMKHCRYMRGYRNVINKCKELNAKGEESPLAMETSGHAALKENYYLDDGAFLAVKLAAAAANAKRSGKKLEDMISSFPPPVTFDEWRLPILCEEYTEYGREVLENFRLYAIEAGLREEAGFEGVRLSFSGENDWLLLRASMHESMMVLDMEAESEESRAKIIDAVYDMLKKYEKLDISSLL